MDSVFKGQVVWITGASSGIGEAMARDFVARGSRVILTARRIERLEGLAQELNQSAEVAKVLAADLSKIDTFPALTYEAIECFGHIDVLFNNAGISQRSQVIDTPFEIEEQMIKIDLLSPIALTKAILPHFSSRGKGRILVTSSLMGELELPGNATYSCVKHGLNGYFYSMGFEVEKLGIKVQVIEPGFVRTEVSESALTATGQLYGKMDATQANAMTASEFSRRVFPKIERGKTRIIIGGKERFAIPFKRIFPGLYRHFIRNFAKRLLKDRMPSSELN